MPLREEVVPIHDIYITSRVPGFRQATLEPEGRTLDVEEIENAIRVRVPRLERHAIVTIGR